MGISVEVRPFQLRVISALLTDVAAGLLLLLFALRDIIVLTASALLAIIFIIFSMRIERMLDEL